MLQNGRYVTLYPMERKLVKIETRLPAELASEALPAIVVASGGKSACRFLEFFATQIRNPHTRLAYSRAVCSFFAWCEKKRVSDLAAIQTSHAALIEHLGKVRSMPNRQTLLSVR